MLPAASCRRTQAISPVSTVVMSMLLLREYPTLPIFLSLIPIVFGIMLATVTEIHFDMVGV
jgi:solute carrier family 35 protein E1